MIIRLPRPDDWHVHLRQGEALGDYARAHALSFGRVLAMPNTVPPLTSPEAILEYRRNAEAAAPGLEVITAFRLMPGTVAADIAALAKAGIHAGKYYPDGASTNSSGGLNNWRQVENALGTMEDEGMVLCLHGEDPCAPVLEREKAFLPVFREIRRAYPRLRMVLEHVSSSEGVQAVADADGPTAATVTVQHLLFTLDDLLGGMLKPHLFCKPLVKFDSDRQAIQAKVLAGDPRFFFGSDSAPHPRDQKHSERCPAGVYSAPTALPALAAWFEDEGAMDRLKPFVCDFGRLFYGEDPNEGETVLERRSWTVPELAQGCVPLMAGRVLPWQVV